MDTIDTLTEHSSSPRVVIVGGGFAGLAAARALAGAPARVTLLDRRNYHVFLPLLYQVATAALSPGDIAGPIRSPLARQRNARVLLAEVEAVDLEARTVTVAGGEVIVYDALILAAGGRTGYVGRDEWAALAPGLKTVEDALAIRRRLLHAFEAAERESDPVTRRRLLTFVVVGGGPTGVELAGALAELARHTLRGEFRAIDPARARVVLLEGGPRLLAAFPEALAASAARQLARLGVEVRTGALVAGLAPGSVTLGTGEVIEAVTVLWAAGTVAAPPAGLEREARDRAGRLLVAPDLSLPGHPEVFAVGDLARVELRAGRPLPGVVQAALQAGRASGENVGRRLAGRPTRPLRYRDPGAMAIVGRAAAVADLGWARLTGLPAWLLWLAVHLWYLDGLDNRLLVLVQWAWSAVAHRRGARLITDAPTSSQTPIPMALHASGRSPNLPIS
jgi:NADH dehydrogenase